MELVSESPVIETSFQVSLPHDLFATLILVESAERLAGLDDWITRAAASLPKALAAEARALVGFLRYCPWAWGRLATDIPTGHAAHTDLPSFIALLEARPASNYRALALEGLRRELARQGVTAPAADKAADWRAALERYNRQRTAEQPDWVERQADPRAVTALARNGAEFKRRLTALLTSFWERIYRAEFTATLPIMQRSVEIHARRPYPTDFYARFQAITGRAMPPAMREALTGVRRMVFIPSYHIGPYFVFTATPPTMQVSFNCRTAGSAAGANGWIIELFPPLRALADETRLQILALLGQRELYAQEIIEALGISQSAASRHLQLLENTGVLAVRKENTAKYYSVNPTKARELIEALQELLNLQ